MAYPRRPPPRQTSPTIRRRRLLALAVLLALLIVGAASFWQSREPVLGNPRARMLLAWTSEEQLPRLVEAARRADGVGSVAEARNGVGWLSSWGPDGGTAESAPSGFRVPVEILAIDPEEYSSFVPGEHRAAFRRLAEGRALLGRTGANLRGIDSEGTLVFPEATVQIAGVVPDELVSGHEVVMSEDTASDLGIEDLKYVLAELEFGTSAQEAEEELRELLPSGTRLGVREPGDAPVFRPGGTLLTQAQIKRRFGEFAARPSGGRSIEVDPAWIRENTTNFRIPLLGTARCHNELVSQVQGAFSEIVERDLDGSVRRGDFGGCFAPRFLDSDPHSGLSHHSWGIAFDFNVSRNPYGAEPAMDRRLVELLEAWGFTWGGDWMVPDGMHFEYLTEPQAGKK